MQRGSQETRCSPSKLNQWLAAVAVQTIQAMILQADSCPVSESLSVTPTRKLQEAKKAADIQGGCVCCPIMHFYGLLLKLTYLSRVPKAAAFSVWKYTPVSSQLSCCSPLQTRELQQALHEAEAHAKTLESSQVQLRNQVDSLNQRLQQSEHARALDKKQAAEACLARERERDAAKDLADKYKKGMEEETAHAEEQQGLVQSLKDKMEVRLWLEDLIAVPIAHTTSSPG